MPIPFVELLIINAMGKPKKNLKRFSNEELIPMYTDEVIKTVKAERDGLAAPKPRFSDELKRRGYEVQITDGFIRRILSGEFG